VLACQFYADTRAEALCPNCNVLVGDVTALPNSLAKLLKPKDESLSRSTGGNEVRGRMLGFTWKEQIVHRCQCFCVRVVKRLMGCAIRLCLTATILRSQHTRAVTVYVRMRWTMCTLRCARVQCNCQTSLGWHGRSAGGAVRWWRTRHIASRVSRPRFLDVLKRNCWCGRCS
jgi:hypothetical protein